jgi:hypothetical protein
MHACTPASSHPHGLEVGPRDGLVAYPVGLVAGGDEVVGVEEVTNLFAINAYPNPTSDLTTVAYSIKESANVTFDVINLVGEKVMSINKGNVAAGNYTQQIDFSTLSAGVYMLNVTINGTANTVRVTVK